MKRNKDVKPPDRRKVKTQQGNDNVKRERVCGIRAATVAGALCVVVKGNDVGQVLCDTRDGKAVCLEHLCKSIVGRSSTGYWEIKHGFGERCHAAAKSPSLPAACDLPDDIDALKQEFATTCDGSIPDTRPPFTSTVTLVPTHHDVMWFMLRERPLVSLWCLLQSWSRPTALPSSIQSITVAVTTAVCALISVTLHPFELLYATALPGLDSYRQSIVRDIRNVCFLYPGQFTVNTGPFLLSSCFESGAMGHSSWLPAENRLMVEAEKDAGTATNRMWFHFSIKRASEAAPKSIMLCITHLGRNLALYKPKEGTAHRPVVSHGTPKNYKRIDTAPKLEDMPDTDDKAILRFPVSFEDGNTVFVAFTFPYTYTMMLKAIEGWSKAYKLDPSCKKLVPGPRAKATYTPPAGLSNTLLSVRVIAMTPDGHPVPMLTIGSSDPEEGAEGKQYIAVTSRVHAGEVPSSHMCHGIVSFLLSDEAKARKLRDRFTFKVVPMLNPDGVFRGQSRADGRGVNLNRVYDLPDRSQHASIWSVSKMLEGLNETQALFGYLDLHAHARKRSVFAYGNTLTGAEGELQNVFAFLVGLRCPLFDYHGCNFTDAEFLKKDKMGTGRKAIGERFGVPITLTIEANYSNGDLTCYKSGKPVKSTAPPFVPQHFHSLGRALVEAFQDLHRETDPSRDALPDFGNVERVRRYVSTALTPGTRPAKKKAATPSPTSARGPAKQNLFRM